MDPALKCRVHSLLRLLLRSLTGVLERSLCCFTSHLDLCVPTAVGEQACLGQSQGQRGVSRRVAQFRERLGVEVVDGVARLVIARVVRLTSSASVNGGFLRS